MKVRINYFLICIIHFVGGRIHKNLTCGFNDSYNFPGGLVGGTNSVTTVKLWHVG